MSALFHEPLSLRARIRLDFEEGKRNDMMRKIRMLFQANGRISISDLPVRMSRKEKDAIIREIASGSENRPCVYGTNVKGDIREVRLA